MKRDEEGGLEESSRKGNFSDDLKRYYSKSFDINLLLKLIDSNKFKFREFGFEIEDKGFTRNRSFEQPNYLVEYLSSFTVTGAYIGAEYDEPVHTKVLNRPGLSIHQTNWVGRELIFDLDGNEYDPVRDCECKGKKSVCPACWPLLQDAAAIIDETLKDDFGFKNIHWLFSGGRGYHCWILDPDAFIMDTEQRTALINYMLLIHDPLGEQRVESLKNSAEQLKSRIFRLLGQNFLFSTPNEVFFEMGIKKQALKTLREKYASITHPNLVDIVPRKINFDDTFLPTLIKYRYPRIDHKVTIDIKRLIRLPGSVHSRTKLLCYPVDDPVTFTLDNAKSLYDFI